MRARTHGHDRQNTAVAPACLSVSPSGRWWCVAGLRAVRVTPRVRRLTSIHHSHCRTHRTLARRLRTHAPTRRKGTNALGVALCGRLLPGGMVIRIIIVLSAVMQTGCLQTTTMSRSHRAHKRTGERRSDSIVGFGEGTFAGIERVRFVFLRLAGFSREPPGLEVERRIHVCMTSASCCPAARCSVLEKRAVFWNRRHRG